VTVCLDLLFTSGIIFLVLGTPFAFGAVPLWAYTTMEVCVFALVIVWMAKRAIRAREEYRAWSTEHGAGQIRNRKSEIRNLAIPLVLFLVFCAMQLVPLPPSLLKILSPQTFETYKQILPGWPERVPYSELESIEQSGGSAEPRVNAINGERENATQVKGQGFGVRGKETNAKDENANNAKKTERTIENLKPVLSEVEVSKLQNSRSPSRLTPYASRLLPVTWRTISISPLFTKIELLKFATFAAVFFLVWRYPFEKPFEDFGFRNSHAGFFILSPEQWFLRSVIFAVLGTGLLVAVFAFIERFAGKGKILLSLAGYDSGASAVRASGPFINPDHFANYLSLILPLALGCTLFRTFMVPKQNEYSLRIFCGFTTFLLFTGILLSLSRGGWINALFGVMVLVWLAPWGSARKRGQRTEVRSQSSTRNPKSETENLTPNHQHRTFASRLTPHGLGRFARVCFACLGILLIGSLFLAGQSGRGQIDARLEQSFQPDLGLAGRPKVWKDSLDLIRDFPLLGVGLGAWPDVFNRYESGPWSSTYFSKAHNDYIEILADTGAVGFALLAWFFIGVGRKLVTGFRKISSKYIPLLAAVLAALGGMALHSSMDFSLQIPANALLFTVLMALGLRLTGMAHSARRTNQRVEAMAPWEIGDQRSTLNADWSEITNSKTEHRRLETGRFAATRNAIVRLGSPVAISALALVLIGCALTQQEEPRTSRSIAEARERLLWRPFKASYHLSVIGRLEDQTPPEWQLREYRAAQWIQPTNPYIRDQIAELLMATGRRDEGLKEMTLSVAYAPSLGRHEYLSAESLPKLSAEERAAVEAGFKQALVWNYPEALTNFADFYAKVQRFSDQAALYEQAAAKEPDVDKKTELLINAGQAYLKAVRDEGLGVRGDARKAERSDAINATNAKDAERLFRTAIVANPTDPKAYQQLIMTFVPARDFDEANKVVALGKTNGAPALPLYLSLAEAAHQAGDEEKTKAALVSAKAEVEKQIRNGENPGTLYKALADSARRAGDRAMETASAAAILEREPRSAETLLRLANLYLEQQNYSRAALYLNRMVSVSPDSADVFYRIALAEEGQYRFAAAGRAYTRAIELAPKNADFRKRYEEFQRRVEQNKLTDDRRPGTEGQTLTAVK